MVNFLTLKFTFFNKKLLKNIKYFQCRHTSKKKNNNKLILKDAREGTMGSIGQMLATQAQESELDLQHPCTKPCVTAHL